MKLIVAIVCVAYASADHLDNTYLLPSNVHTAGGNGNFLGVPIQPQANTYLPPRSNNNFPLYQFNGNYIKSRPTVNQAYGAPNAPNMKYGINSDIKYRAPQFNKARFDGPTGVFSNGFNGFRNGFQGSQNKNGNSQAFARAGLSVDGDAAILKFKNDNNGDGSYSFEYETDNKIMHQESGSLRAADGGDEDSIVAQGSYSYTGPDQVVYTVNYVADENGFRAYGDHLPTPPPIPEAILKSLKLNAAEETATVNQSYSSGPQHVQYNRNNGNQGYN